MKRRLGFHWLPFDGEFIFDKPGIFAIEVDGSSASRQLRACVVVDLKNSANEILELIEVIEELARGKVAPKNVMSGMDGSVFFHQGVVLVASSAVKSRAVLLTSDNFLKVLRAVHAVFASPDFRNPDATFPDVEYEVIAEGEKADEDYKRRGGTYTRWKFDPKRCEMVYDGMPENVKYPHPIPPHLLDLCE